MRVGRNARARLRGGGGGGDGARRGGRLFIFLAPRARCWLLARVPFGPFLVLFRGRCEHRAPGVGPVGLRVGWLVLCSEIALQKRTLEINFVCLGVSSSAPADSYYHASLRPLGQMGSGASGPKLSREIGILQKKVGPGQKSFSPGLLFPVFF